MVRSVVLVFLIFIFECSGVECYGQQTELDSLKMTLQHVKPDTEKISVLIKLAAANKAINLDSSILVAKTARSSAVQLRSDVYEIKSILAIAKLFRSKHFIDSALTYDKIALKGFKRIDDQQILAKIYASLSLDYLGVLKYDSAIQYSEFAMHIQQNQKNTRGIAVCYINLSKIYVSLQKYTLALDYALKALSQSEKFHWVPESGECYLLIADIYYKMPDYTKATLYANRALDIFTKLQDYENLQRSNVLMCNIFVALKKFDKALEYANKPGLTDLYSQNLRLSTIGNVYFGMGDYVRSKDCYEKVLIGVTRLGDAESINKTHLRLGKIGLMLNNSDALTHLKISLAMSQVGKNYMLISQASGWLAYFYNNSKRFDSALKYNQMYYIYLDSVHNQDVRNRIQELQYNYELDKKQYKISQLEKDNLIKEQKNLVKTFILIALTIVLLLLVTFYILLIRKNKLISKQKNEIQLQAANLNELNIFKDKILSILSHDLRSPIVSVRSIVSLLDPSLKLPDEDMVYIKEQMSKQLDGMSLLVDNLLQWASVSQTTTKNVAVEVDIFNLVEISITLLQNVASIKNITIINSVSPNTIAMGSYNQINTVIRNLLANAIKYTPDNGCIKLSANKIGGLMHVSIADSGVGMTKEQIESLFTQEKTSTYGTNGEKGIGLGLTICKEFIEANGGNIFISSQPNEGSTFSFTLPI